MEDKQHGPQAQQQASAVPILSGPPSLTLAATHPLGPLAGRSGWVLRVPAISFTLANTTSRPLSAVTLACEALVQEQDGGSVEASTRLSQNHTALPQDTGVATIDLGPQEGLRLQLSAAGKLPPGRYLSRLRIRVGETAPPLLIPVTVRVAAHWGWAVGFILLGLMFLGLSSFLVGEADVRDKQAEVLTQRQEVHEFLDRFPPPGVHRGLVAEMENQLADALKILSQPRAWTIRDTRLPLAERHLARVQQQFQDLRAKVDQKAVAKAEVEDVDQEWKGLLAHIRAIQEQLQNRARALNLEATWPGLLSTLLQAQHQTFLDQPLQAVEAELGPQVERVWLMLSSGEGSHVRALAVKVKLWVRRAARLLEERVRLLLGWHSFAQEMLARHTALAADVQNPALPEAARKELSQRLAAAQAALEKEISLARFRDAYSALQEATTYDLQVRSAFVVKAAETAMRAAAAETSVAEIEAALSRLIPGDPPAVKQKNLLGILDLWDQRVETCKDEALKKALVESIRELRTLVQSSDLAGMSEGYKKLQDRWLAYGLDRVDQARKAVVNPYCAILATGIREELRVSEERLKLLEPHHALLGLDAELDRVRLGLERVSEQDCLTELITVYKRLLEAGNTMFTTLISLADIPPEARLTVAEHSGVQVAIALARRLLTEPRPLRVVARAHPDELYVGAWVILEVDDLHPTWGPGITVAIDFGDGSAPVYKSAEQLRQGELPAHRYESPKRFTVRVVAGEHFLANSPEPAGDMLGEGKIVLDIRPSPISAARALADRFLTLRFLIALASALLVQGWRFYGERPFGAQARDYLEAFALGIGIDAGTRGMAEILTKIGLPK